MLQIVTENEYKYSENKILSLLKNDKDSLIYLLERGYIKVDRNNYYAFCFVGVITIKDILICCYPKYYIGHDINDLDCNLSEFKDIIKIFKQLDKFDSIPDYTLLNSDNLPEISEIILADKIIKHYIDYGLFNRTESIKELNSDGEIDWDFTISSLNPIVSKKQIIYNDVYNNTQVSEFYNLIREIQKWAIHYSLTKYGKILDYQFSISDDHLSDLKLLGDIDYLLSLIQRELQKSYLDKDISLLKLLYHLISKRHNHSSTQFSLYGTGSFHAVWEKICSDVFQNEIDIYKDHIPRPIWSDLLGNKKELRTFRPDIIVDSHDQFYILDAKYYNFSYGDDFFDVKNNPGIGDVSKQFLYAQIFEKYLEKETINIFLFPKIQQEFTRYVGYVELPILFDSKIHNILLSPQQLFHKYLKINLDQSILETLKLEIEKNSLARDLHAPLVKQGKSIQSEENSIFNN